jgi:PAS domain S-box-containing protein
MSRPQEKIKHRQLAPGPEPDGSQATITELKRCLEEAEAALQAERAERQRLESALGASQMDLASLFEAFPLGITISDDKGKILQTNRAAERLLGLQRDEHEKRTINGAEWRIIHPDGSPMPAEEYASVRALKEKRRIENVEMGIVKADQSVTWICVTATPLPGEDHHIVITYSDISERKKYEQALRESEGRLKVLSEAMPQIVWSADAAGSMDYYNQQAYEYGGVQPGDIEGWKWEAVIHPDDLKSTLESWRRSLASGEPYSIEQRLRRYDGEYRWHLTRGLAIKDEHGKIVRWVGTATDVHDQKLAAEALRQWEERFAKAFRESPAGLSITRLSDGAFLDVNDSFIKMLGYSRQELIGHTSVELNMFAKPAERAELTRALQHNGSLRNAEIALRTKSGQMIDVLFSLETIKLGSEECILATIIDISDRKRIEKSLKESEARSRTQLQELDLIYKSSPVGLFAMDRDLRYLRINEALAEMNGKPAEEFIERTLEEVMPELAHLKPAWQTVLKQGRPLQNIEVKIFYEKINETRYRLASYYPMKSEAGEVTGLVGAVTDITELKRAEQALRENQSLLKTIMDGAPNPVFMKDRQSRLLLANPATFEVLGKPAEAVIGKSDDQLFNDHKIGRALIENDRRVIASGLTEVVEEKIPTLDGERIFLTNKAPYRDADGAIIGVIGVAQDITERKIRENELYLLNRTITALSDSRHAMIHAKTEGEYLENVCRIIVEDCGHRMVWVGLAMDDAEKTVQPAAYAGLELGYLDTVNVSWGTSERGRGPSGRAIRTGKPMVVRDISSDPSFNPWREDALKRGYRSLLAIPLKSNGKAFGVINIYSKSIDAFSMDEANLLNELANDLAYGIVTIRTRLAHAEIEETIRASEARYRALFDRMDEGFAFHEIVYDDGGNACDFRFSEVNSGFERITGLKREELLGNPVGSGILGRDPLWEEIYKKAAPGGQEIHFENYYTPQKQFYDVYTYYPAARQFAVLLINITERKQVEQILQEQAYLLEEGIQDRTRAVESANQKLKEALANEQNLHLQLVQSEKHTAMGRLLASVTHELNNPIQTIQNCLYLIKMEMAADAPGQDSLEMATAEINRIAKLVSQVRQVYRPNLGDQKRPADPGQILEEVHTLLAPHLQMEKVTWQSNGLDQPIAVLVIPDQIKQVFINLCINAIEAMQPSGGTLSIEVKVPKNSRMVKVSFKDSGPGISAENLPRIFEPFFTTKKTGTGLGLSICYDIVKRLDGNLTVDSQPGMGATFTIWLPLFEAGKTVDE